MFSFRFTVHLLFSFLLQKTLESVFLPRYESLNLNHDTNYLMTSEETAVGLLMGFQFNIKSKSLSFRVTVHLLFSFLLQKTLESVFLPRCESLKLNHDTNFLIKTEDTVVDPLMGVQFNIKSRGFFISCYSLATVFFFLQKTLVSVFRPRYESLKLNHDTIFLITTEDTVVDPMMSFQFFINGKSFFHFVLQSIYCFHFYCKRRFNLYFYHAMDL